MQTSNESYYKIAFALAIFTIIFAFIESVFSTYFGYCDESLTLFGFGVGSCIEVISGIGIAHMVVRIERHPEGNRDKFEKMALRITGICFYILVGGLIVTAIYNAYKGHKPGTTLPGIIISLFSIGFMSALVFGKTKIGKQLDSKAILADANCTMICIYMSLVLLATSGIYAITKFAYIDEIGTLGLAYFSFKEGRECFEKAKSNKICCEDD